MKRRGRREATRQTCHLAGDEIVVAVLRLEELKTLGRYASVAELDLGA